MGSQLHVSIPFLAECGMLGHNAYSSMTYSLFLEERKAFTMMVVHIASDAFVGTVA
jgi:hypothetical protein